MVPETLRVRQDFYPHLGLCPRALAEKDGFRSTLLTKRQWEVVRYRAQGLTQAELAKRLNTSRENVTEIEHRVGFKIRAAKATLAALEDLDASGEMLIPSGTCLFEAISMILRRADVLEIKLRSSADDILALMRSKCRTKIRGHHLISYVRVQIEKGGSLTLKID